MTTEERMDVIRLKQMLAPETLTEKEIMCLQIEQHGFGCSSSTTKGSPHD